MSRRTRYNAHVRAYRSRELAAVSKLTSRDVAGWRYGWAKGWPDAWSYPSRPRPAPKPEGKGHLAATNHYRHRNKDGTTRETTKWDERHRKRRAALEGLRLASFYVRRHWPRLGDVWAEGGPCAGQTVVDPLDLFNQIDTCCADVALRPTSGGVHGNTAVYVRRCKRYKLCAVCAHEESRQRAARVLVVAARGGRPGRLLSVVLTHRDQPPHVERVAAAWFRHESAWQRLRTGKNGEWWRANVYGFQANLESTTGQTGYSWHPHTHFILELHPGVDVDAFRNELARRWRRCTTLAALEMGIGVELYDDRLSALRRAARAAGRSLRAANEEALRHVEDAIGWSRAAGWKDGRERWCELLEGETEEELRDAIVEATKYATPHVEDMSPARLAEWIQWAQGRRLVRWGGAWEREDVQAWITAQIEYNNAEHLKEEIAAGNRPDIGELIRGAQEPIGLARVAAAEAEDKAKRLEGGARIEFEQLGLSRSLQSIQDARDWWRILGEQRAALRAARLDLDGPDDRRTTELATLRALLTSIRKLPVAELRSAWTRIQREIERNGVFG